MQASAVGGLSNEQFDDEDIILNHCLVISLSRFLLLKEVIMKASLRCYLLLILTTGFLLICSAAQAKDPQLAPKRISSTGDSITEAFNAELPLVNHWASWVNGYRGFWEWMLGLSNVNSHNQRILAQFGEKGYRNFMEAVSGTDSDDFARQAHRAVVHAATYVTVFMGHNDVCKGDFEDIPDDAEFEGNMRAGFDILAAGLPAGAAIYVAGLVDIYELWVVAHDKQALRIADCEKLWALTLVDLFPCSTMLDPRIGEAGRQYTRSRNMAFNQILTDLVYEYNAADDRHHWYYTDDVFDMGIPYESMISDIDCFHPSVGGQRELSEATWNSTEGPQF